MNWFVLKFVTVANVRVAHKLVHFSGPHQVSRSNCGGPWAGPFEVHIG